MDTVNTANNDTGGTPGPVPAGGGGAHSGRVRVYPAGPRSPRERSS
jgi:hypothetical protein